LGYDRLSAREIGADLLKFLISKKGNELIQNMRSKYDVIVVDGPPIFASAEALLLASIADEVLLAVRWGSTDRRVVRNAAELLRRSSTSEDGEVPARLKTILTRADLSAHARYRYGDAAELLLNYDRQQLWTARSPNASLPHLISTESVRPGTLRLLLALCRRALPSWDRNVGKHPESAAGLRSDSAGPA
jgi:hypothetical protein